MNPCEIFLVLLLALGALCATGVLAAEQSAKLLLAPGFGTDPRAAGWTHKPGKDGSSAPVRADTAGHSSPQCLAAADGAWESPMFPVEPFEFYRLEFFSKAEAAGYWAAFFYDEHGAELAADCYATVYPSDAWLKNETCFRGRAKSVKAQVRFIPSEGKCIWIDDVSVRAVARRAVAEWADALYAMLPPLQYAPAAERGKLIPKTLERLRSGQRLRVVLLGDSIVNDTSNSPWDVLVERQYPGARIEAVISVLGGKGCRYYKDENRVQEYVLQYAPDLVILGGISHGYDAEAIRSVIKQLRASCGAEIMVLTGAVANTQHCRSEFIKFSGMVPEQAAEQADMFPQRVQTMAAEEKCEFLDMRSIWDEYVKDAGRPEEWFRRDIIHANDRAKQILGRVLEKHFAP